MFWKSRCAVFMFSLMTQVAQLAKTHQKINLKIRILGGARSLIDWEDLLQQVIKIRLLFCIKFLHMFGNCGIQWEIHYLSCLYSYEGNKPTYTLKISYQIIII